METDQRMTDHPEKTPHMDRKGKTDLEEDVHEM